MLFASPVNDNSSFFLHLRHTSQHYSLFFKSVVTVFLYYELVHGLFVISWERAWTLLILRVFRHIIHGPNCSEKDCHLCRWGEFIRCNPSQNAAFFPKSEHTIEQAVALSFPVSKVYARNAWVLATNYDQQKYQLLKNVAILKPAILQENLSVTACAQKPCLLCIILSK